MSGPPVHLMRIVVLRDTEAWLVKLSSPKVQYGPAPLESGHGLKVGDTVVVVDFNNMSHLAIVSTYPYGSRT